MKSLKEHFKNRLLNNLLEGNTRIQIPRGVYNYSSADFEDPHETGDSIDPIDPVESRDLAQTQPSVDSTVANIVDPKGKLMNRDFELMAARKAAQRANVLNAFYKPRTFSPRDPEKTTAKRWEKTRFVSNAQSSLPPTEEEMQRRARIRNLLDTVHHFSRNHGIELKPEHIEGIDFNNPDIRLHIAEIARRLG